MKHFYPALGVGQAFLAQCLQAYGFVRILYGLALKNTEYGEPIKLYGFVTYSENGQQRAWRGTCRPE